MSPVAITLLVIVIVLAIIIAVLYSIVAWLSGLTNPC